MAEEGEQVTLCFLGQLQSAHRKLHVREMPTHISGKLGDPTASAAHLALDNSLYLKMRDRWGLGKITQ